MIPDSGRVKGRVAQLAVGGDESRIRRGGREGCDRKKEQRPFGHIWRSVSEIRAVSKNSCTKRTPGNFPFCIKCYPRPSRGAASRRNGEDLPQSPCAERTDRGPTGYRRVRPRIGGVNRGPSSDSQARRRCRSLERAADIDGEGRAKPRSTPNAQPSRARCASSASCAFRYSASPPNSKIWRTESGILGNVCSRPAW
jgi:hypothetical protein